MSGVSTSSVPPCKGNPCQIFKVTVVHALARGLHKGFLSDTAFFSSCVLLGNDAVDEDVDIVGGNDAPVSCLLPVEIEKDGVHRNSKCSSSSSSGTESGSSSSGSPFCRSLSTFSFHKVMLSLLEVVLFNCIERITFYDYQCTNTRYIFLCSSLRHNLLLYIFDFLFVKFILLRAHYFEFGR